MHRLTSIAVQFHHREVEFRASLRPCAQHCRDERITEHADEMNSLRPPSWLLHSLRDPRTRRPAVIVIAIASCCFLFFLTSSSSSHSENSYAYPPSRAPPGSEAAKVQDPDTLQSQAVSLLDALDARPILEYAPALEQESQPGRCPNTWRQANRDMMRNEGENVWPTMTAKDLAEARRKIVDKVKARFGWEQGGRPKSERGLGGMLGQEGRGIVATAGK